MTAKQVLNKIMTLLSKDEVNLTYAKLKDGTIVESATFDVGEDLFVISEDGTKTPAPDGEHELSLKDTEGNETLLKVITKDGKIEERENVELADEDAETVKVEDLPSADGAKAVEDVQMAEETEEVESLPEDTDKETPSIEIELKNMVEKLAYRIEEMEKKMEEMGKMKMEEETKKEEDVKMEEDEEDLPKLNGAPIEVKMASVELNRKNYGKKPMSTQDSFLSKLYK
jgi:flagellar biosynthesis GTPase FlhF